MFQICNLETTLGEWDYVSCGPWVMEASSSVSTHIFSILLLGFISESSFSESGGVHDR